MDCAEIYLPLQQATVVAEIVTTVALLPVEALVVSLAASSAGVEMLAPTPSLLLFPTGRICAIIGAQLALVRQVFEEPPLCPFASASSPALSPRSIALRRRAELVLFCSRQQVGVARIAQTYAMQLVDVISLPCT